ncbi:creatininase [Mycobacterium dioxanotrophicus]|jgi:creatinine amidohydrolase|uniref:Creatininase n=1 Tax=Mycobacterium dioxanotrophicus TaxID=482462 RepID=A0A1Y0CCQ1_9MYCO|nr:creatininase family protein [Mycobacterium dioxanotrophicus]ART72824.1 creatininase [Mycobacterium dioxanotrophicus]
MNEVRIEFMTSAEIDVAISEGARTAILPLGAVEQHGGHLPLSMDADHADALAVRVARHLGGALVLPTVRVGYSPHHLGFTGTLSLRASTLESVCEDYCRHLAKDGFERIVMFSGHIGNHPVMRDFEVRLAEALAPLTVIVFSDTEAILNAWRRAAEIVAFLGANVGGHADIAETSVMLELHPQKVRLDRLSRGYTGRVDQQLLDRAFQDGIGAVSPNGVLGDPEGASERIGAACLDAVTSLIADYARARGA